MHRLLPLGIALAFLGSWLGFIPVHAGKFECGSLYSPKTVATDFGPGLAPELRGLAEDAFGSVNEACAEQRTQLVVLPMAAIVVAGVGTAVFGGVAWRRKAVAARAA